MHTIQLLQGPPPPNSSIRSENSIDEIDLEKVILVPYEKSFAYKKKKLVPSSALDHILKNPQDLPSNWMINPDGYDFMRIIFRGTTFYYASLHIFFYHRCLTYYLKNKELKCDGLHIGANSYEYGYVPVLND